MQRLKEPHHWPWHQQRTSIRTPACSSCRCSKESIGTLLPLTSAGHSATAVISIAIRSNAIRQPVHVAKAVLRNPQPVLAAPALCHCHSPSKSSKLADYVRHTFHKLMHLNQVTAVQPVTGTWQPAAAAGRPASTSWPQARCWSRASGTARA